MGTRDVVFVCLFDVSTCNENEVNRKTWFDTTFANIVTMILLTMNQNLFPDQLNSTETTKHIIPTKKNPRRPLTIAKLKQKNVFFVYFDQV